MYMGNYYSTKESKTYNGGKKASSINCVGKTGQPHTKNETRLLFDTIHKNNSKWIKNLNIRIGTIKYSHNSVLVTFRTCQTLYSLHFDKKKNVSALSTHSRLLALPALA